jgi:hypothetical protein
MQVMFGSAREHGRQHCVRVKPGALPKSTNRQIVSGMASAEQRERCVPRVAIGAVFACRAGVEVLWACVVSWAEGATATYLQPCQHHPSPTRQIALPDMR